MILMANKINWSSILSNRRVQLVLVATILALALIAMNGIHTGIEFSGGVRIPITLSTKVDPATMDSIVETLKLRINKFGLSQSVVRPVGNDEVLVEVPKASAEVIDSVRKILREQGKFEVVIDSQVALTGSDILPGAVGGSNQENVLSSTTGKTWELGFSVSRAGGESFARAALGKGNYPVYMFLDRPTQAVVIARRSTILPNGTSFVGSSPQNAVVDVLRKSGDDISIIYAEDFSNASSIPAGAKNAVVEQGIDKQYPQIMSALTAANLSVKFVDAVTMKPEFIPISSFGAPNTISISSWPAIGLKSGPILSPQLATGSVSQMFQVTGPARGDTAAAQDADAKMQIRELKSVISGGKLPVSTTIGSSITVAPSLGERFLAYSWIAVFISIFAVSLLIFVRYRRASLVLPIVFFNSVEVLLTTAIVGVFGTLDLSAMAGIIVLMGSGVADQIVITEEMLRGGPGEEEEEKKEVGHDHYDLKDRLGKSFYVIFTLAGAVVAAMIPLVLSGIVEIVGFGISAILGVLVGVFLTRPAYGEFMKVVFAKQQKE